MTSTEKTGLSVVLLHGAYADGSSWSEVIKLPGHSAVAGLVYVAARAPDAREDYRALAGRFPAPSASAGLVYTGRFRAPTEDAFLDDFAKGAEQGLARVLYAVQLPESETLLAEPDDGSGLAVTAGAARGLPECRISCPGMAISRRRKAAIMALPGIRRALPSPRRHYQFLWCRLIKPGGRPGARPVELTRSRLKESAMSAANNESSYARDGCSAQCYAPRVVTRGSPGISVPKRELFFGSWQFVSAAVVLPDLENSLLPGTKIAGW
jgi:hypothetical protein